MKKLLKACVVFYFISTVGNCVNIYYSLSHSSPPEAEISPPEAEGTSTPHPPRKLGLFKTSLRIHAFGILGVVGPLDKIHGWMVTDFAAWIFLISNMSGYSNKRSLWRTIRQINHLFPNDSVTFGDAGCDRLQLPLPSPFETDSDGPARVFVFNSLVLLQQMARKVNRNELLVLLLIGHGDVKDGDFQFLIITQPDKIEGETFITKAELEAAVNFCKGDILIICNSCYSGHLVSDRWTLLCSSAPDPAYALTQSGSGYVRGSVFTACLVAQTAHEHGLQVPLPQIDPRTGLDDMGPLPPSPPSHSFPGIQLSTLKPSNMTLKEFVCRMQNFEKLLVTSSPNLFQTRGPTRKSTVSWTQILPLKFTTEAVGLINVIPSSTDYINRYNEMIVIASDSEGLQGRPSIPSSESQTHQLDPLLIKLVTAMPVPDIGGGPRTFEIIYADICADLRRHIAEPQTYASPLQPHTIGERGLLLVVRAIHVQAVAIQLIARVLGWCNADVMPFLPWNLRNRSGYIGEMIANGVRVDELPWHLKINHFNEYVQCFNFI